MNHEISPETMKQQIKMILSNPAASLYHAASKALFDMLIALETNKIPYEFIDPETQEEATQQNLKLQSAARPGNVATAIAERERLIVRRDEAMSSEIIKQSRQHDGGIIFLAGFQHKHLVKLLESNQHDFYRYALFTDSSKDQFPSRMSPVGNGDWGDLPNAAVPAHS